MKNSPYIEKKIILRKLQIQNRATLNPMWISSNGRAACRFIYKRMAMTDVTREITPAVFKGALPGRPAKRNKKIKKLTFFITKKSFSL